MKGKRERRIDGRRSHGEKKGRIDPLQCKWNFGKSGATEEVTRRLSKEEEKRRAEFTSGLRRKSRFH